VLAAAFLWGGYSASQNVFPFRELRAVKAYAIDVIRGPQVERPAASLMAERFEKDALERLVGDAHKSPTPCPPQGSRTAVLLLLGQSNAANSGGQRYRSTQGARVLNFHAGRCFLAESPLLGSTGFNGEHWTLLGDALVTAGVLDTVVLVPAAFGGTEIAQWLPGSRLDRALRETIAGIRSAGYRTTHVLWHQGEHDAFHRTDQQTYTGRFLALLDTLRSEGVTAPVLVSVATKCSILRSHAADNPVQIAQRSLPAIAPGVYAGVDTDALLNDIDRYDDCHFSASGQRKVADAWLEILRKPIAGLPSASPAGVTGSIVPLPAPGRP
jgi:hypothetical protein